MDIQYSENKIIIRNAKGLDLKKTFECGQCFRFDAVEGGFEGVAYGKLLSFSQKDGAIELTGVTKEEFDSLVYDFLDLGRDYCEIEKLFENDSVLKPIIPFSSGIRILKQQPFEALISFIISASNNIPRIKKIIGLLCENFGEKCVFGNRVYYAFPTPKRLAKLDISELAVIRAGFRDKYILDCAKRVHSGECDLESIREMSYTDAKHKLMKIKGVGEKVADCALLFGFGFAESFPKDVWIKRILKQYYGVETNVGIDFFGYDGIAQQYLFYYARENSIK